LDAGKALEFNYTFDGSEDYTVCQLTTDYIYIYTVHQLTTDEWTAEYYGGGVAKADKLV
jgi:hypothetical protein